MPSLVALAVLATIGALHYGLPDLPFDAPITSEPVAAGVSITGRASVIDGDTIEIHSERIRILGIDAPEARQLRGPEGKLWLCGVTAGGSNPVITTKPEGAFTHDVIEKAKAM